MNKKRRFFLTSTFLVMGVFVVTNISLAAVGLQVGNSSLNLGAAENLYYGNISASSATTSNLLLLQNAGVSKLRIDYYGNLTTPATITAGSFVGPLSGIITAANVSSGAFGSNTGGGNYSFPGNVGIGTSSPGEKLEVNGGNIKINQPTNVSAYLSLNPNSTALGSTYQWNLIGTNSAASYAFQIREGNSPYLTILNSAGGNGGYVGIGTTAPTGKLTISDNSALVLDTQNDLTKPFIGFGSYWNGSTIVAQGGSYYGMAIEGTRGFPIANSKIDFSIGGSGGSFTKLMTIRGDGNVGVGITNPTSKMDVSGVVRSSGFNNAPVTQIVKGLTWSRIVDLNENGVLGTSFIVSISGTRNYVVWNSVWQVSTSHHADGYITLLSSTDYTQTKLRLVVDINGGGYLEFYDQGYNAVLGTNQNVNLTVNNFIGTSAALTSFQDGTDTTGFTVMPEVISIPGGIISQGGALFAGNVGIGTTNPDHLFHVQGASDPVMSVGTDTNNKAWMRWNTANKYLDFTTRESSTYYANTLVLKSGNVGIGTTAPNDKLSIGLAGSAAPAGSDSTGHNYTNTYTSTDNYALVNYGIVKSLIAAATSTMTAGTNFWGGTKNANIWNGDAGAGNVGIGTTGPRTKLDVASGDIAVDSGYAMQFIASNLDYNKIERDTTAGGLAIYTGGAKMVNILDTGNVGIGTTNPGTKLEVAGNNQFIWANGNGSGITVGPPGATASIYEISGNGRIRFDNNYDNGDFSATEFRGIKGGVWSTPLTLLNNGNVGIGTTNPSAKLEVSGGFAVIDNTGAPGVYYRAGGNNKAYLGYDGAGTGIQLYNFTSGTELKILDTGALTYNGNVGIGTTAPNDKFSIGMGGVAALAGSDGTGHNYTQTYLSTDNYALANYGLVKTLIAGGSGSSVGYWTMSGANIYNSNSGNVGIGIAAPGYKAEIQRVETVDRTSYNDILAVTANATTMPYSGHGGGIVFRGTTYRSGTGNVNYARIGSILNDHSGTTAGSDLFFDVAPLDDGALVRAMTIKYNGNVGIGTMSPQRNLEIAASEPAIMLNGPITDWMLYSDGTNIHIYDATAWVPRVTFKNDGNVGIGTANPTTQMSGTNGIGIFHASYPSVGFKNNSTSWLWYGADNTLRLWNVSAAEILTATSGGNVGIGTTNPGAQMHIYKAGSTSGITTGLKVNHEANADDRVVHFTGNEAAGGVNDFVMLQTGNVGIGTTGPLDKFSIGMGGVAALAGSDGTGHNNTQTYVGTDNYALVNVGYAKSMMGGSYLPLAGGTMTGDVNFGGKNITNLNALTVSKITATTIDPLYNIRGINYSTFAPSISGGVKEEYVGKASIKRYNSKAREYEYVVDFDLETEGSDLWVWRQVVDYSDSSVQVIVTPSGKFAAVYYLVRGNQLVLRSDRQVEVSYRLIANRYDWREWPTKAKDQSQTGVIIK